jgi:27-O-demethylrifamycin SV methyltransferase
MGNDLHFGYFENPDTGLSEATERLTRRMAEWADLRGELRVLDVGCGIGGPAISLGRTVGCQVTGISTSAIGVRTATSRAEEAGLSHRMEFFESDGMANGFPPASFDRVWIMESSHLMERKDLLLAESARVLEPGGLLVLCDIILRERIPFQYVVRNLGEFENLNAVFGKQHVELLGQYTESLEISGLKVLRTEDISGAVLPTLGYWRHNAERHSDEVRELVGRDYLDRFVRGCVFLQRLWNEGKLGYGMMLARKSAN